MRFKPIACLASASLLLGACNKEPAGNDAELRKQIDQLVQTTKSIGEATGGIATSSKATADDVKGLNAKVDALRDAMTDALSKQKRGALYLALDADATCDNDETCANTARSICNRINYPNAITSKFTPGVRPTLHALVCFD